MIVHKQDGWLAARVGTEVLMMSVERGLYLGLSEVGARIWELLDGCPDSVAICDRLESEFVVTRETCAAEVALFLDQLAAQGVVRCEPPG
ncbi:PqqD family protein [Sphingomonas qomolangmaensis]|uniref:PqqD family protein n=1 Tax=Sphingomonas qomolangmaensis TaxID=2918765 RepID=A0ABY5L912_9SPHN|nr:PqqD family protein [Sphingomonas qomolangmaensis]UUL82451.1 PqqD family protein [Sphingomonas qomolangmaensis]